MAAPCPGSRFLATEGEVGMRAVRTMICLGLMGVLATATCDGDNNDDKRSNQGKGEAPKEAPPTSAGGGIGGDVEQDPADALRPPVRLRAGRYELP